MPLRLLVHPLAAHILTLLRDRELKQRLAQLGLSSLDELLDAVHSQIAAAQEGGTILASQDDDE